MSVSFFYQAHFGEFSYLFPKVILVRTVLGQCLEAQSLPCRNLLATVESCWDRAEDHL